MSPTVQLASDLFQLGAWNIQGKPLELAMSALHDFAVDLHVVGLQEVGGIREADQTPDVTVSEIDGFVFLIARPFGCFRHVAIGLDADCITEWCSCQVGHYG